MKFEEEPARRKGRRVVQARVQHVPKSENTERLARNWKCYRKRRKW